MGTESFLLIRSDSVGKSEQQQFKLMQRNIWDGGPRGAGQGQHILEFLRQVESDGRWDEFVCKCDKLEHFADDDPIYQDVRHLENFLHLVREWRPRSRPHTAFVLDGLKRAYAATADKRLGAFQDHPEYRLSHELLDRVTRSEWDFRTWLGLARSISPETGASILHMIMAGEINKVHFCSTYCLRTPKSFSEWGYIIDCAINILSICANRELLIYSIHGPDRECGGENPLSAVDGALPLIARYPITDLPSTEELARLGLSDDESAINEPEE